MSRKVKTICKLSNFGAPKADAFDEEINEFIARSYVASPEISFKSNVVKDRQGFTYPQFIAHITYKDVRE